MHGKDITIPKGTEITAYVAGDTPLDPAGFKQATASDSASGSKIETVATGTSSVTIKSSPDGAEITVDGKLMGTTPSTLQLSPGEHVLMIEKAGFKVWQRTITVAAGGSVNFEATLDRVP